MKQKDRDFLFLPPLLTIGSFIVLFLFRSLDDNRLTSWLWVFRQGNAPRVFAILVAMCGLVFMYARFFRGKVFPGIHSYLFHDKIDERRPFFVSVLLKSRSIPIFVISFIACMFFWSIPEVIIDASRYFTEAKYLELFGAGYFFSEWGREIQAWTDMPLIPFLYGLIFRFAGESREYIQVFTTFLFAMTCVLTYRTGRELWDDETGMYGASFLLCIPYLFTQVPLMLVDVPTMFFLMLSVYLSIKALKFGGIWLVFAPAAIFLASLSKYSAWLMLSVLPVMMIVLTFGNAAPGRRTCFSRAAGIVIASFLLMGLFFYANYPVVKEQIQLLMSYQKPALRRWEESFLSAFVFQAHPFAAAFALFSLYVAARKRDWKYAVIFWLVALIVLFQIRRMRYIVVVFPFYCLMAAYGLRYLRSVETKSVVVACSVLSSLVIAFFAYLPFMHELSAENLKRTGEFLDTRDATEVEVHVIEPDDPAGSLIVAVPIIDLFTRKTIFHKEDVFRERANEDVGLSPLRFTWQFRNPPYYKKPEYRIDPDVVAVISDSAKTTLPAYLAEKLAGFDLVKSFDADEGIFRFRTSVRVYERKKLTELSDRSSNYKVDL